MRRAEITFFGHRGRHAEHSIFTHRASSQWFGSGP